MASYNYQTVSQAINELQKRGYSIDFNLDENLEAFNSGELKPSDYKIVEVHRYEGNSDPGDEAVVYAIESKKGEKGILVSGFGISSGRRAQDLVSKLKILQD
jgi:hypothetical protein